MYSEKAGLDSTSDISDPSRKAGEGGGWEMPLSPAQQGVWFGQLLQPTSSTYNIAEYLQIHGQITPAIFVQALQEVLAEAPSLHLTFVDTGEGPVARSAVHEGWSLPIIDCSGEADPQTTAQAWMRADLAHLVDPAKGPLFGFALLQVAPDCFLFYQRYHHLIADGATRAMITRRLAQVYSALVTRHEPEPCWFADAEHLFSEAASYQASDEWHTDKQHWLDYLDSAPEPSSLSCRRTHDEGILRSSLYLTQAQTAGLKDMAQGHGVSMPQLLVALISIYLSRITGKNELIVGFPVAARHTTALRHTPGMLANVVPLRLALIREQGLSTLLRQVGEKITQALAHRRYPSEVLYRDLGLMARQESLFAHSISIEPFDYDCRFAGHSITPHNLANGPAADLNLFAFNRGTQAGIELHIDANAALYEMGDVQGHLEGLARLFQAVLDRPELPLGRFDLLGAPMRQLLLEDWNQTGTPYPDNLCIHQLFEQQVSCAPDASALVHDGQHLSYAELNARANRLAHHLRELGVTADTRVAICLERSLEQVVAVLAVLKAGGAYVPLDPAYPAERLADMLTDSDPCVLLTHGAALAPPSGTARIDLQTDAHHWATLPADNPSLDGLTARHLAYVIYTSGSTGQPKGVMVEHRGLVNLSRAQIALYGLTPASRVIQFASFSFDACVWEMVMALGAGATLYLPSEPQRQVGLFDYLTEHRITHATLPPALLQGRTDLDALDRLETLVLAGEAPSAALIQALGRRVQVHNAYGPTETTVCATDWACLSTLSAEPVSIGRPLPNTRAYVLDAHGEPVPVGVAGELWVGGVGVARGYLNREQLTAEQFKASPFLEGDRLYRTGDLVRYLADGNLEYLGRADQQVKIRGFRIELGEIETLLRGHPAVREAAVIARADDAGAKRLVAYVVPVSGDELSLAQTLRGHLQARLPDYMVPAAYVTLASLPLTTNGKLDQRALPAPDTTAFVQGAYEKPRGETEKLLAGIWQQLLGVERVGRQDNFFELGGHSLLAVRLLSRIRQALGSEVELGDLFAAPCLHALAQRVRAAGASQLPDIEPVAREGLLPLSFAQQRLWFLAQMDGMSEVYHMPMSLHLHGALDEHALRRSLERIHARHEALRSVFVVVDGQPRVAISAPGGGLPLEVVDLRHTAPTTLHERCTQEARGPFDLAGGPLIRARLLRLADEEHVLMLTQHHIVSDGWSIGLLLHELSALYGAYRQGLDDPLPALTVQYPDYAAWQRRWLGGGALSNQTQYWRERLLGAPELLTLPTDRPRPAQQSFEGASVPVRLDAGLTEKLKALGQRHGTTLFMTVLSAWAAVLSRLSGQQSVVIGTPTANRGRREIESLLGFFVNTLALHVDLAGQPDVRQLLERVRETAVSAQVHQDLPFEQVVEALNPARRLEHTPVFQVMFSWQNDDFAVNLAGLQATPIELECTSSKYDLELDLRESGGALVGSLVYPVALFDRLTVVRHLGYLEAMLRAMVADPGQAVERVPLLSAQERRLQVQDWNQTQADFPRHSCLHSLFEAQVRQAPERLAVLHDQQRLSYGELNTRANRLAHELRRHGVRPGDLVAICAHRSPDMLVALLAVLKAGAAYVPMDPAYPAQRLAFMLDDCAPALVLTHAAARGALEAALEQAVPIALLDLDRDAVQWADSPDGDAPLAELTARHLAYVIYTSGSTGQPKGVMVEHCSVVNQVSFMARECALGEGDRFLQFASFAFDVAVEEVFATLLSGAALVLRDDQWLRSPKDFLAHCSAQAVTVMDLPTAFWQSVTVDRHLSIPPTLRQIIIGGEALSEDALARWFEREGHRPALVNAYGPTEATVNATLAHLNGPCDWSHIGRPTANTHLYVLDDQGEPVPLGVAGELWIGGAGVARGYLNRDDLNTRHFHTSRFVDGDRLYRTGDRVRYLSDGTLQFQGRSDFQVKLRGFRIELGEIEAALREHPQVREAAVLAREEQAGEKRLVAYVVPTQSTQPESAQSLRTHLQARLPDYMVPAAYVTLASLPLTTNGKLDRQALPVPQEDAYARHGYEAPQGEVEVALAALWQEVLGVEKVGRQDNFFELGGHSLLAVRLLSRIRQALGSEVELGDLFAAPCLHALAQRVRAAGASQLPDIEPVAREGLLPLSFAQQRLWFLAQMDGMSEVYHMPMSLHLHGALDEHALRRSLERIHARHEALRSVFVVVDGQPRVAISAPGGGLPLEVVDLRHTAPTTLHERCTQEARGPFDLAGGPLIRARLLRLADEEHVLMLTQHHIVSDGWSIGLLLHELSALYGAYRQGLDDPLPALTVQYPDYAAWQRRWLGGGALSNQTQYWRERLLGAPELLTLPTDRPRPAQQSFEGASVPVRLDAGLTEKLKALGQRHGTTLFMTVLSAWAAVLSRLSGQQSVVIGTPTANRGRREIESLLGFFVNTLALHVDLAGQPDVRQLLERVRETAVSAQVHQDLPFEQVVEALNPARRLEHTPVFQVMFSWQNDDFAVNLAGLQATPIELECTSSKYDLELDLRESGGALVGSLVYPVALFDRLTVVRHLGYLEAMLRAMVADPGQTVERIALLSASERQLLLETWNQTGVPYPQDRCLHQLFEAQAARVPGHVAVRCEAQSLSYGELNSQANRLAHHLVDLGVKPGDRVAICTLRSLEMLVALLAVLKAGAAYVPLDPAYPPQRLAFVLQDSDPRLVLTHGPARDACAMALEETSQRPVVNLDDTQAWAHQPATDLVLADLTAQHLAYVIYTSGSTGQPKGVANEHAAVVNRLLWMQDEYDLTPEDAVLQKTPFSFDVSVWEFFWPLFTGARLVMARSEGHKDPIYLGEVIEAEQITILHFVPSMLDIFLAHGDLSRCASLKRVMCSGEALPGSVVRRFKTQLPQSGLHNLYGPTEAAVDVTAWNCAGPIEDTPDNTPIGKPIANCRMYVLDAQMQPVPLGVVGELYIGGVQVARGYLNRAQLTVERFLDDPFSNVANARMYRTGDVARYMPDGAIEYLGRNDDQVKIRGLRIELGEIQARLIAFPAVQEAVVVAREDAPGDKRLVAYYTAAEMPEIDALRAHLLEQLPDYMVPVLFVHLETLPLSPNGKLDRKALPVPRENAYARQDYEAPQGDVEMTLAALWQEVLGVEKVGRHDNFFELGGHSLLGVQLISRIRQADLSVDIQMLFSAPTLSALGTSVKKMVEWVI